MIITVVNQKGGVGKTTTSVNLAYVLSKSHNVALLDLDPEGGSTASLGVRRVKSELKLGERSVNVHGIELFYAHVGLLNLELSGEVESIVQGIKELSKSFDYLVIDTPPNLGTLSVSAMIAGDKIVVPLTPHPLTLEVTKNLNDRLGSLKKQALAFTNMSTKPVQLNAENLKSVELFVPPSKLFTEASRLGVPAVKYEEVRIKKQRIAPAFEALAKVVTS